MVNFKRDAQKFLDDLFTRLKSHDIETYGHCHRVGQMTLELAKAMNLSEQEQNLGYYSGLLHDVGKLLIPESIINKPSKLTAEEYEIVKKHAQYGVELIEPLKHFPQFDKIKEAILYHHERVDGQGYYGLKAHKIPLLSKLILIVDTVDAMTQDRAYRKGRPIEVAYEELIRCSGTQFEAAIVDIYLDKVAGYTTLKIAA